MNGEILGTRTPGGDSGIMSGAQMPAGYKMEQRIYAFDLLKLLGAIGVSLLHYNWKLIPQGYLLVEMFFIMSGFCLYLRLPFYSRKSLWQIFARRLGSFYAFYLMALFLQIILSGKIPAPYLLANSVLFLGDLGIGPRFAYGSLWFLGVYLFCFMGYMFLFRVISVEKALLIIFATVFVLLCSAYTYSPAHCLNRVSEAIVGPFQFGVLRGIIGLGWGILTAAAVVQLKQIKPVKCILAGGLSVAFLIYYLVHTATVSYDFINYAVIAVLVSSCYGGAEQLNKVFAGLGQKFFYFCSLSLPIYIFHMVVVDMIPKFGFILHNTPPGIYLVTVGLLAMVMKFLKEKSETILSRFGAAERK